MMHTALDKLNVQTCNFIVEWYSGIGIESEIMTFPILP